LAHFEILLIASTVVPSNAHLGTGVSPDAAIVLKPRSGLNAEGVASALKGQIN
jgi:hypothetical protein